MAYHYGWKRGSPIGSDQEDWFQAEEMLKNALVVQCEDRFRSPSITCCDTRTESEMLAEFPWEGHWEVWEREWIGVGLGYARLTRWRFESTCLRHGCLGGSAVPFGRVSAVCSGRRERRGTAARALGIEKVVGPGDVFSELVDQPMAGIAGQAGRTDIRQEEPPSLGTVLSSAQRRSQSELGRAFCRDLLKWNQCADRLRFRAGS
jgi:hypothetical protein